MTVMDKPNTNDEDEDVDGNNIIWISEGIPRSSLASLLRRPSRAGPRDALLTAPPSLPSPLFLSLPPSLALSFPPP